MESAPLRIPRALPWQTQYSGVKNHFPLNLLRYWL
jgi:hypothetical protein